MEEFIFDDDVDEVGAEVEAHCPKCRADTAHVVVSKYEDEIRRVQCNPCGDVHPFRKPRGENEEETAEATPKKKVKAKPTWEQVMAKSKKAPRPYALGEYYKEMEILAHPKFGVGYVTENIGDDKIEVTFQADKRVLIHNRKGLNLPVAMLKSFNPPMPKGKGKGKAQKPAVAEAKPPKALPKGALAKGKGTHKGASRPVAKRPVTARATPQATHATKKAKAAAKPPAHKARPAAKAAAKKRAAAPLHKKTKAKAHKPVAKKAKKR
jgi:hypothetical protein